MQPKRDPNDRRYWPLRQGGTGQGFAKTDRASHPLRYRAIENPRSIDEIRSRGKTAEGIRTRARLILERALDRVEAAIEEDDNPLPLKDLNATVAALGRIAGVQSTDVNIQGSVAHLHLDALRAPRKLNSDNVLDSARLINTVEEVNTVASLPRGDASI